MTHVTSGLAAQLPARRRLGPRAREVVAVDLLPVDRALQKLRVHALIVAIAYQRAEPGGGDSTLIGRTESAMLTIKVSDDFESDSYALLLKVDGREYSCPLSLPVAEGARGDIACAGAAGDLALTLRRQREHSHCSQ